MIDTAVVRVGFVTEIGAHVDGTDLRIGNQGLGRIGDTTGQGGIGGLAAQPRRNHDNEYQSECVNLAHRILSSWEVRNLSVLSSEVEQKANFGVPLSRYDLIKGPR